MSDSDDEDDLGHTENKLTPGNSPELPSQIKCWLLDTDPSTGDYTAAKGSADE